MTSTRRTIFITGAASGIGRETAQLFADRGWFVGIADVDAASAMSSTSSLYGVPELAVYSATKHAVRALTEALSLELERYGIGVSDIVAPYVRTPLVVDAERKAYSVTTTGIRLLPEDVAHVVWRAVHGHRLHWRVHPLTHVLGFVLWLAPFARRPLVRQLCLSPEHRAAKPTAVGRDA